jgi:Flp pilus assembly CpaF family ATPase
MRPGALAVGEVRAGEALDLLVALNAGVPDIGEACSLLEALCGCRD